MEIQWVPAVRSGPQHMVARSSSSTAGGMMGRLFMVRFILDKLAVPQGQSYSSFTNEPFQSDALIREKMHEGEPIEIRSEIRGVTTCSNK